MRKEGPRIMFLGLNNVMCNKVEIKQETLVCCNKLETNDVNK